MCRAEMHHLPVVDDRGRCLGVLDAQTITMAWDTTGPGRARKPVTVLLRGRAPATVAPETPIPDAARAMLESGTDSVAVAGEDGALRGLITGRDLVGALAGEPRRRGAHRSGMPSLYRIEPILPDRPTVHPGTSRIPPA
ncbi:CBS domain-containing protein [Actinomadura hibisca]|uniref:CBS domain-containing protein n=1 Tax=Actinomadura hibisca TaxID=68565 RepID=UPI00082CA7C6|nr:CBS domain-containing protein [Actinomadura hibisca]